MLFSLAGEEAAVEQIIPPVVTEHIVSVEVAEVVDIPLLNLRFRLLQIINIV